MKVSVIIPTYNGAHKILNALRSLEKQNDIPDEVVVVVDGSTDNTVELLKQQQFNFKCFKIIEQENGGRAQVRNRGAKEANGELLIFLDDDMIVPEEWLTAHINHHVKHPQSLMSGKFDDPYKDSKEEFWRFIHWLDNSWQKNVSIDESKPLKYAYLSAANFSISHSVFFNIGGFDERLNDAEDFDLATTAIEKKLPLYFNSQAIALHDDHNVASFKGYIKRLRRYNIAQAQLIHLKPGTYSNLKKKRNMNILKKAIFFGVANQIWINSMEKLWWKKLPLNFRFKIYDIIVTANSSVFPNNVFL